MKQKLFFGSHNEKKLAEIQDLLPDFHVLNFKDIPIFDVEETGKTLEENAILKAHYFYEKVQIPCFSDDSGLEVFSLNGEPGVLSARYAGEHGNSEGNIKKLLAELEKIQAFRPESRLAQFRTVIAYYDGVQTKVFEGIVRGNIISEKRGANGFGYDPIFVPENYHQTFAEMTPETKNFISHRAKALQKLKNFLISET